MGIFEMPDSSVYDSHRNANEILEQHDAYIVALARKKVPRTIIHPQMLGDEIDELAQKIRIKLWQMVQTKQITSPKAYISCIAFTESVDMVRLHKFSGLPLPVNEDGEIYLGDRMVTPCERMQDPAEKLEQEEVVIEWTKRLVEDVLALPQRQLHAIICILKDQLEDIHPFLDALRNHGVGIEEINWPDGREEVQSIRASLSIARKKLRALKDKYDHE